VNRMGRMREGLVGGIVATGAPCPSLILPI